MEQWVPAPLNEVFSFFSDANNLEKLTPGWLHFKVLGKSTPEIKQGTLIDYQLSIHGIRLRWQSKIIDWAPGKQFVDIQVKGPYQLWHHTHEFKTVSGGTLMVDRIKYRSKGWLLAPLLEAAFVGPDIRRIFAFRHRIIGRLFGSA